MNNNQINFDPMTGQPINTENASTPTISQQNIPIVGLEQEENIPHTQVNQYNTFTQQTIDTYNNNASVQQQMQVIPTVEQSKQEFINNTQANNTIKKEENKEGPNITFIAILFAIIFAAIFFLFPYLIKVL